MKGTIFCWVMGRQFLEHFEKLCVPKPFVDDVYEQVDSVFA